MSTTEEFTVDTTVKQGVKVLKDPKNATVDIVAVPGLGADPENSWLWRSKKPGADFNWLTDSRGLELDFPEARVMLYQYESAFKGRFKVQQFMTNIAVTLLYALKIKREGVEKRPLVLIGHSMGGLVISKAICLSEAYRERFPDMYESFSGCLFFGTPFDGAPAAAAASMFASIGEKIGKSVRSTLLDLLTPGNEGLRELKHEFMRLSGKLSQHIELFCIYETAQTDFAKMLNVPWLKQVFDIAIPQNIQDFVSRDSATLPGILSLGLARTHRDLVRFESFKDEKYQMVREPLKHLVHGAPLVARNRFNATRQTIIDRPTVSKIISTLEGANVAKQRKILSQNVSSPSWILTAENYVEWLERGEIRDDYEWIRGPQGKGKTNATLTAINTIEDMIRADEKSNSGQSPPLLAYFFCSSDTETSSAEELLKSLVRQLISQQETLGAYAKQFVKGGSKAQLSVDNLWQALQEMLSDDPSGTVYFVLSNLHELVEDAESTKKLLNYIKEDIQRTPEEDEKRIRTKWLFTSRERGYLGESLILDNARLVDLTDPKYDDKVQIELRKHAQTKIAAIGSRKNYSKALTYFAGSLIGKRAENIKWIDVAAIQLSALPDSSSDFKVQRILEGIPQDLRVVLDRAWQSILDSQDDEVETTKEILRVLVLTYQDPTEDELAVLTGIYSIEESGQHKLRSLVAKCKPLLTYSKPDKITERICFVNADVKAHLQESSKKLLGLSEEETKWQHGIIALRAFTHVVQKFTEAVKAEKEEQKASSTEQKTAEEPSETKVAGGNSATHAAREASEHHDNAEEKEEEDEEDEEEEELDDAEWSDGDYFEDEHKEEHAKSCFHALEYPVKYWLRHASKATLDIADMLSQEDDFWKPESELRAHWLQQYAELTGAFNDLDIASLKGLHVAATVGFNQLVISLLKNGYNDEINLHDAMANTPLHLAAAFGRINIVEELLNNGSTVDDQGPDGKQWTPLHMAAYTGQTKVMDKLIARGANPNCVADEIGPVINAAILSGSIEAVQMLLEKGIILSVQQLQSETTIPVENPPLAMAALLSDLNIFNSILQAGEGQFTPEEYDEAFKQAAEAGRKEVLAPLLDFEHSDDCFEEALTAALEEDNWEIVRTILPNVHNQEKCDSLFVKACISSEQLDDMLDAIWEHTEGSISAAALGNALYEATDNEKESTVKALLEKFGADANAEGEEFGNALTAAAYDGTVNIVRALLEAGADVNAETGFALQAAAAQGHYNVVEIMLKNEVDVNRICEHEKCPEGTALQAACDYGRDKIVGLLLDNGADPNIGSGPYTLPIISATRKGEAKILERLLKADGIEVNVFGGPDGSTPLNNAASTLLTDSLQLLVDAGADLNLVDPDGDTPLLVAVDRGDLDCVKFMIERGADIMHVNDNRDCSILEYAACLPVNEEILKLLMKRASIILRTLKREADGGNEELAGLIQTAKAEAQDESNVHPKVQEVNGAGGESRDEDNEADGVKDAEDNEPEDEEPEDEEAEDEEQKDEE